MASDAAASDKAANRGALSEADLMSLERYARDREAFRANVIAHKRARTVAVGPNMTWVFEDRLTIQYQVQEMLRIERIFEPQGIREELDTYNPLIPDGGNWKATMMIEYPDPHERAVALGRLRGVEDHCFVEVAGHDRVCAIADQDLERENAEKTSAVHWLRFELPPALREAVHEGAAITVGCDHPGYRHSTTLPADSARALGRDLS
ncbi:MAG: DUF3501 family protein [Steroidobacteraceae bacterium]